MKHLEIDAGNTFVKWRFRCADKVAEVHQILTADVRKGAVDVPADWIQAEQVWVASVAGDEVNSWLQGVFAHLEIALAFVQVSAQQHGLKNAYEEPQQMGVDRWVAMLAAWQQTKRGVCVVDAGSAVTVDFVDARGDHLGGYIVPGLRLLQESLLGSTAGVRWARSPGDQSLQPGHSTAACVSNGGRYLQAALLQQVRDDCQCYAIDEIILTGGDAAELHRLTNIGKVQQTLVLDGLQWVREE